MQIIVFCVLTLYFFRTRQFYTQKRGDPVAAHVKKHLCFASTYVCLRISTLLNNLHVVPDRRIQALEGGLVPNSGSKAYPALNLTPHLLTPESATAPPKSAAFPPFSFMNLHFCAEKTPFGFKKIRLDSARCHLDSKPSISTSINRICSLNYLLQDLLAPIQIIN
jgi:hypothetical protein